jgi:hypothetical protein
VSWAHARSDPAVHPAAAGEQTVVNILGKFTVLSLERIDHIDHVTGGCGGLTIKVGCHFERAVLYRKLQSLKAVDGVPIQEEVPVDLRVVSIYVAGKECREMGPGVKGKLLLSGEGAEKVTRDMVLVSFRSPPPGRRAGGYGAPWLARFFGLKGHLPRHS